LSGAPECRGHDVQENRFTSFLRSGVEDKYSVGSIRYKLVQSLEIHITLKNVVFWDVRSAALARTDVSEERITPLSG
jgi:hypothetical protein